MKTRILLFIILFFVKNGVGQIDSVAYSYAQTIDTNDINSIIYTLAADSMLGRNTASEGRN